VRFATNISEKLTPELPLPSAASRGGAARAGCAAGITVFVSVVLVVDVMDLGWSSTSMEGRRRRE